MTSTRRSTLRDVARAAGVSEATASRVLHLRAERIPISEATQTRIRAVARELGYRPNHLARSLSRSRTDTIGVILPLGAEHLGGPYYSTIMAGIAQAASARGVALALYYVDAADRQHYARAMHDGRVDGGLIIDSTPLTPQQLARLEEERLPTIVLGHRLDGTRISFVAADDRGATAALTRHLLDLGHRHLVHLHYPFGSPTGQRTLGFLDAMAAAGLADDPGIVVEDHQDYEAGPINYLALLQDLLRRPDPPTAIVAWSDVVAAAILQGALQLGLRVPDELSVVGYNDLIFAQLTHPPLTTVQQPQFEIGRVAADLLIDRIERQYAGKIDTEPVQRILAASLVIRQSCTSPPL